MAKTFRLGVTRKLRQAANMKKVTPVVRRLDIVAWPEPTWTPPDNEKIIWGFWEAGEDAMPPLCRFATESWQIRNPTWTVIIRQRSQLPAVRVIQRRTYHLPEFTPTTSK
jgi:hypothetical protein